MNKVSKKISLITIILIFIFSCSLFLAPMKIVKAAAAIFEAGCQGKYGSRK